MLTPGELIQKGWQQENPSEFLSVYDNTSIYCLFLDAEKCSIGIQEDDDLATPVYEGKIESWQMLEELLQMTIRFPEDGTDEYFDVIGWLEDQGWETEERECRTEIDGNTYTCSEVDDGCYIITVEDEFDEEPYYLYNGSILSEEQAIMIITGIGIVSDHK